MPEEPLLSVEELTTVFDTAGGPVVAVNRVSFGVSPGETLGLVGESGSGKSVTALSILRLVRPPGRIAGGRVLFNGRDLLTLSESDMHRVRGGGIGFVFQEPGAALNPVFTIGSQIEETLAVHGVARGRAARLRAMIAIAIACNPTLLVADEPTTALDVTVQAQILELLRDLQARLALGLILITHDFGIVAEMADRVAVMYAGRIVEQGPVRELFRQPQDPYTRQLLEAIPGRSASDEC